MTNIEAYDALVNRRIVHAGQPGTEDYDEGVIVAIEGNVATVAWQSGVRTPTPISDLSE